MASKPIVLSNFSMEALYNMGIMNYLKLASLGLIICTAVACASQKNQTSSENKRPSNEMVSAPNFYTILEQMDGNSDGKIALSEARGPLEKEFSNIDRNGDGFITNAEFQNAPKPEKAKPEGQRPPPGQGGGPPR